MYNNLGIIGHPLNHTLSPLLHNFFMYKANINGGYCCFDIENADKISQTLDNIKNWSFRGINVTLPYKTEVIKYLDFIGDDALKIGAVNTIVFETERSLKGYNTDITGIKKTFEINSVNCNDKDILVIGAGGSAKALIYYLSDKRFRSLCLINRDLSKAERMLKEINVGSVNIKDTDFLKNQQYYDIIINTTSKGLDGGNFFDMGEWTAENLPLIFSTPVRRRRF